MSGQPLATADAAFLTDAELSRLWHVMRQRGDFTPEQMAEIDSMADRARARRLAATNSPEFPR